MASDIHDTDTEDILQTETDAIEFDESAFLSSYEDFFKSNPELKALTEQLIPLYDDEYGFSDADADTETEVDCYEFEGKDYIIARTISIGDNLYYFFVNISDAFDFFFQKRLVEDGEEYFVALDDEKEFDLIQTYLHRELLLKVKEKLQQTDSISSIPSDTDVE